MNNMHDILARMTLLEGKGKPDFLDLDRDGDREEPMKKAAQEVDEAGYSAKAARAGKDIGKPGKAFAQIAKSAGERYGSKERGEKVAGAVLAKLRAKEDVNEADMEEGNEFSGARTAAIRAGKPTFTVAGKTYRVSGDTSDEKVMEREMKDKDEFDRWANPGDTVRTAKGTLIKTASGVKHERRADDEEDSEDNDDDAAPKKRGRPKGPAKGPERVTAKAWKHKDGRKVKESELEEDYDRDEYDEEGEMAKSQARTIEDAAQELQDILDDQENLPEWVQKKITLAKEYIDSARDYMKANRPEQQPMMAEKAVSKAQRAAAGIAYAAKKGDIPKSELRGASKEMAKMPAGELKKFAKTKEKGLPEKKKKEVDETTVSGSVATAPAEAPKGKKGMIFGKGVYESQLEESYSGRLKTMLTEGMSINMSVGEDGQKNLTVTATDDDAVKLAQMLRLAGMEQPHDYHDACSTCGDDTGMCEHAQIDEELANAPDETYADIDTIINKLAGGLNGPKRQINPNNMADNPMAMTKLGKAPGAQINLGETMKNVQADTEQRLMDLYKKYKD